MFVSNTVISELEKNTYKINITLVRYIPLKYLQRKMCWAESLANHV